VLVDPAPVLEFEVPPAVPLVSLPLVLRFLLLRLWPPLEVDVDELPPDPV